MISVALSLMTAEPSTPGTIRADLDVHAVFDDVDDLVDDEAHGAAGVGEHQHRLGAFRLVASPSLT
jgi:hypothetical protein